MQNTILNTLTILEKTIEWTNPPGFQSRVTQSESTAKPINDINSFTQKLNESGYNIPEDLVKTTFSYLANISTENPNLFLQKAICTKDFLQQLTIQTSTIKVMSNKDIQKSIIQIMTDGLYSSIMNTISFKELCIKLSSINTDLLWKNTQYLLDRGILSTFGSAYTKESTKIFIA